jgi:methyltransferase family protein
MTAPNNVIYDASYDLGTGPGAPWVATPTLPITFVQCAKFFNTVRVGGVVARREHILRAVDSSDKRFLASAIAFQPGDGTVPSAAFAVQLLLLEDQFLADLPLRFQFEGLPTFSVTLGAIAESAHRASGRLLIRFNKIISREGYRRMLDIGGRARSGVLRAENFRDKEVVVLDVLPDSGVDVVCDAHRMSEVLEAGSFDMVSSFAVFEHLVMPWKVAIEMNRILRVGGVGLIVTHQTIGMHDMPWDYFRFSDSAWKGLFNAHTGFRVLDTELGDLQHIIPSVYQDQYSQAENAGGFMYSGVLIRKISETTLDWPLSSADVTNDAYPE